MLQRLLLIPAGLLIGALVVELILQVLAFVAQSSVDATLASRWLTGSVRVLCLGDSNTYGLHMSRENTYPAQLEAVWNERGDTPGLEVMNLGIPGMNSSSLLRDYPTRLQTFEPDIVIIMIGANDFWTLPVPIAEDDPAAGWLNTLRRRSKLYRYFKMVTRAGETPKVEVVLTRRGEDGSEHAVQFGDQRFDVEWTRSVDRHADRDSRALRRNLTSIVDRSRDFGVELYLMTYPAERRLYRDANEVVRSLSLPNPVRVIDLASEFVSHCETPECPALLLKDGHPNAAGYRRIAETVADRARRDRAVP